VGGVRGADRAISDEPTPFSNLPGEMLSYDLVAPVRDGLNFGGLVGELTTCPALGEVTLNERTPSSSPSWALEISDLGWREGLEGSVGGLE
jgi:hypothetical protein